jgi:hypothetical protein
LLAELRKLLHARFVHPDLRASECPEQLAELLPGLLMIEYFVGGIEKKESPLRDYERKIPKNHLEVLHRLAHFR